MSRLALDRLRSAQKRRGIYVGEWLPEPIVTETVRASDPLVAEAPPRADVPQASNALEHIASALRRGDVVQVSALLHHDVTFTGDADGKAPATRRTEVGAAKVARFLMGLQTRYGPNWMRDSRPVLVNGVLGSSSMGSAAADNYPATDPRITAVVVEAFSPHKH